MPLTLDSYRFLIAEEEDADSTASFIGIVVAISGNVLISLALNCQKLAHRRLERERREARRRDSHPYEHARNGFGYSRSNLALQSHESIREERNNSSDDEDRTRVGSSHQQSPNSDDEESEYGVPFPQVGSVTPSTPKSSRLAPPSLSYRDRATGLHLETEPLLASSHASTPGGSLRGSVRSLRTPRSKSTPGVLTRLFTSGTRARERPVNTDDLEAPSSPLTSAGRVNAQNITSVLPTPASERTAPRIHFAEDDEFEDDVADTDYLKSKLWHVLESLCEARCLMCFHPQVVRILPHEHRGVRKLHILCLCTRICRSASWHRKLCSFPK